MAPKVSSRRGANSLTILFDETPHLRISLETFIGFQSWLWKNPRATFERGLHGAPYYEIEIYFSDCAPIKLGYDNVELWKAVLAELDK